MFLFEDSVHQDFIEWKSANPKGFTWWSYVNEKGDLALALAFAKFLFPEIEEKEGGLFIKDAMNYELYDSWKQELSDEISELERVINLYALKDFFHIHTPDPDEQLVLSLGDTLKTTWAMAAASQFPDRDVEIELFEYYDDIHITMFTKHRK